MQPIRSLFNHYISRFVCLISLLVFATCSVGQKDKEPFLQTYGGKPYMGTVQVDIRLPDGSHALTDYGDGSAHFVKNAAGKVQMIVFGAIKDKKGDAGFAVEGVCDKMTWRSNSGGVLLQVEENGKITGSGTNQAQVFQFSGKIADVRLELVTELKTQQASGKGYPAGTTYVFRYTLRRDLAKESKGKKDCDRIVWQPQYVGNFDGSGTTVQVPRCVND